jgi:uncharacterized membrane protein
MEKIMRTNGLRRTESAAAIAKHPLHPFLAAFPITFLVSAFLTDVMFWHSGDLFWARASLWLLGAGLLTGIVAAMAGLMDFLAVKRARALAAGWVHFIGNDIALLITAWNLWRRTEDLAGNIVPTGIILSGIVMLIFGVTGWLGGELAFRHHIGMIQENEIRQG